MIFEPNITWVMIEFSVLKARYENDSKVTKCQSSEKPKYHRTQSSKKYLSPQMYGAKRSKAKQYSGKWLESNKELKL